MKAKEEIKFLLVASPVIGALIALALLLVTYASIRDARLFEADVLLRGWLVASAMVPVFLLAFRPLFALKSVRYPVLITTVLSALLAVAATFVRPSALLFGSVAESQVEAPLHLRLIPFLIIGILLGWSERSRRRRAAENQR